MADARPAPAAVQAPPPAYPAAERRLVSVLFADLVGFTSFAESRDPDDVRDFLTRYFDTSRQLISRYGGTVEKFIGDAVMAVWGTPTAQEDDAERAVRAALDLAQAVAALGEETGAPDLRARAGVLTGEASVTLGAEGQGMVAGDLVNTASRVQAVAPPGTVYVGESTRRPTEAAIVYEDSGTHQLKGKAEPIQLYRAVRVIGGRGGALKAHGLEAPFVGRGRELRLVKDLFHASVEERRAHLLLVMGIAGIGKSRLSWEFFKYIDGLAQTVRWHRGRCLSYGDGVTYWALAEMVRGRAEILEGEEAASAAAKLHASVGQWIADPDERGWVEPRLAHLLGLEDRVARDAEDLFAAWRLFFERIAEREPTVMVFEDMQWADRALLDFIDYLMNWSRNHPLFVMALARPELADRSPEWAMSRRGSTILHLEPLTEPDMHRLLQGLVPGMPEALERQILERGEGVPLYAIETIRMLVDRGLLASEGAAYRLAGPVETLEVPESLHALIASRLDALEPEDRALVQNAAVLGKTFTKAGLAALTGSSEADLDAPLGTLVRKEILGIQADPRSPERGQYGFLQDLVRKVAYETLSRKERKARHLAAAAFIHNSWGAEEVEIVEVLAAHYLEAYASAPEALDAAEIKAKARDALVLAGQRSESLAAPREAFRYYKQAIELTDEPVTLAEIQERAGVTSWSAGSPEGRRHLEAAIDGFRRQGLEREAARAMARLGEFVWSDGQFEEAMSRMEEAYEVLARGEPDEAVAQLASQVGRLKFFRGDSTDALEWLERALGLAERLMVPEVISMALNTKALVLWGMGRREEGELLLRHALTVALDHDLRIPAFRAYNNLGATIDGVDRFEEELELYERGLEMARRYGDRGWEFKFLADPIGALALMGRWDEAVARAAEIESAEGIASVQGILVELMAVPSLHAWRGELDAARRFLDRFRSFEGSDEIQARAGYQMVRTHILQAEGRYREALEAARRAMELRGVLGVDNKIVKMTLVEATDAAFRLSDLEAVEELLTPIEALPPGQRTPSLSAIAAWIRARLDAAQGQNQAIGSNFSASTEGFRLAGMPFFLARVLLDHGEWLIGQGRPAEAGPLLLEARGHFERLRARPWLERVDGASGGRMVARSANAMGT